MKAFCGPLTRRFRHIVLPALAPAAFFLIASTPVEERIKTYGRKRGGSTGLGRTSINIDIYI